MSNLQVAPPVLEVTCTRFNTLTAGTVPPLSNPPSAPESITDYGTPPDSPSHLTTQPAPLAIHPPIHPAPPATIHPLSLTHIPLALLPTPMPEAYVLNWAAHYVTGSSNLSPPKTLLVLHTHSVRSTPPVTPPLTFTETDVFIVRMEDEPGERPPHLALTFSSVLTTSHEDEAPPPSNPASAPASDFDKSEGDSDSSSHGSSHAQTPACSYIFSSTNLWSRARYAFSAASRSYLAVFKEIDNSPDLIRRRATRVVTDARSKFGLDLHARHSRRVNKSRRTYNDDLDSAPISLPRSAGGSYEYSEDEASSLRGGEAKTPEFAPEYSPSDTPSVPPGPPRTRRAFNPEQGYLFSYPISAAPSERAAPPLVPPISSLPATAPPAYSGLLSPHLRPSTPAPYPPPNPNFGKDSGYDAFHPWYDPDGDLASHASHSRARSVLVAAPVPPGLDLGLDLGLGLAPSAPVISTAPHIPVLASPLIVTAPAPAVPVLVTAPYEPIPAAPVLVTAPYEPIATTPRPASVYAESNASDDLRSEKGFHARAQAV